MISEIRQALRMLRRSRGFTAMAIGAMALGIGASTAVFSVVNKVLLEPLPYPASGRLVELMSTSPLGKQTVVSIPKYLAWRAHTHSFEALAAFDIGAPSLNLTESGEPLALRTAHVSSGYFQVFGVPIERGRGFDEWEDSASGPHVAMISYALWRARFHSFPGVVGGRIAIEGRDYRVVGVVGASFHADPPADIWLPLRAAEFRGDGLSRVRVVGQLRPGVTVATAADAVRETMGAFRANNPNAPLLYREEFTAIPLRDALVGDVRPALTLLMGAVAFLLLISCANVAHLLLARSTRRAREIAIRAALGAKRSAIVRQLLTESLLIALGGGAAGLVLAWAGVRELLAVSPLDVPSVAFNGAVFGFALAVSLATGVLFGLAPALSASRADLATLVKASTAQSGMGWRRDWGRSALVVAEMALALVLLAGAGLLIRTLTGQRAIDRGFDEHNVLTAEVSLGARFEQTAAVAAMEREGQRRLREIPGVTAVATTSSLPLEASLILPFTSMERDQRQVGKYHGAAAWRSISPDYFTVFGIRLLRGRTFTDADDQNGPAVVLINRAMLRKYWPEVDANPIGEFIQVGKGMVEDRPRQIVGVVADVREAGLQREPALYVPLAQVPDGLNARNNALLPVTWAVRWDGAAGLSGAAVEKALNEASGGAAMGRIRTMHEVAAASSARIEFFTLLLAIFAGLALVLAVVGLYGLMAYSVEQRAREMAIRMALGAQPRNVRNLVVGAGMRLAAAGIAVGVPAAVMLTRVMNSVVVGMAVWDAGVFASVAAILAAVAMAASYLPSRRATRVDPAGALRAE